MADKNEISVQPAYGRAYRWFRRCAEFVIGPIRASAAAVVKSFVFEAGVKSLSAFCEYSVCRLPENDSIPQNPAPVRGIEYAGNALLQRLDGAGGTGAASSGASIAKTKKTNPQPKARETCSGCNTAKTGLVLDSRSMRAIFQWNVGSRVLELGRRTLIMASST